MKFAIYNKYGPIMKFFNSPWFYVLMAGITILGILTGWYLFLFLAIPLSLFRSGKKK